MTLSHNKLAYAVMHNFLEWNRGFIDIGVYFADSREYDQLLGLLTSCMAQIIGAWQLCSLVKIDDRRFRVANTVYPVGIPESSIFSSSNFRDSPFIS